MIFKSRAHINDELWNSCIANAVNSLVYGTTWYLDAIIKNWDAFIWEEDGRYMAVFPIPNRSKLGVKYVYPPFFIQQLGVFSRTENIREYTKEALFALEGKYKFIELNLNWKSGSGEERINLVLDLNQSFDKLTRNFSSNHQRNIKKSQKHKFTYNSNIEVDRIVENFRKEKGAQITTLKEQDYQQFLDLCEVAKNKSVLITRGIMEGNRLITGAVFLKSGTRLIFIFSGNTDEGKVSGGLFNLLNLVIEEFSNSNLILDFEGSSTEGLKRFYKGFGSKKECYYFYRSNKLPKVIKWLKR